MTAMSDSPKNIVVMQKCEFFAEMCHIFSNCTQTPIHLYTKVFERF
jgi:hypothetical protein